MPWRSSAVGESGCTIADCREAAAPFRHHPEMGDFPLGNVSAGVGREDVREHWAKRNANGEVRGVDGLTLIADEWNRAAATAATSGAGGADRPSVLFLHGGGQNRYSWKNTCQILADEGLHVVALDSRGHGDSDRCPDANYSVDALCADTLAVIDQIGRPVILIGASMGGMTAFSPPTKQVRTR